MAVDLPYLPTYLRMGVLFGDSSDPDRDPDVVTADEGYVLLTPKLGNIAVPDESTRKMLLGIAAFKGEVKEGGRIAWENDVADPDNNVLCVDLTDPSLPSHIEGDGMATYTVQFVNVKAAGSMIFKRNVFDVRIAPDTVGPSGVVDLADQIPTDAAAPIVVDLRKGDTGDPGVSVESLGVSGGDLTYELDDGTTGTAGPLPVGPGGSDAGVAGYIGTPGSATQTALSAQMAQLKAWAKNPDNLVAGALTYSGGLLASAVVEWPDGIPGELTILSRQSGTDAVTSYKITRVVGSTTTKYTQPTITRDSSGNATAVPQITVA